MIHKLTRTVKDARSFYREAIPSKSFFRILFELIIWYLRNEGVLIEYFFLGLHVKQSNMTNMLARREFHRIHNSLNRGYYRAVLEDKMLFDRYMQGLNYPVAPNIGYAERETIHFYDHRRSIPVADLHKHEIHCFCKHHIGCGGSGVFKLDTGGGEIRINNVLSNIQNLSELLTQGIFVLQNIIQQHPEMNRLNSTSVNSLRLYTVNTGNTYRCLGGFLRIGLGDSVVDNTGMGNLTCPITSDGVLADAAFQYQPSRSFHEKHPVTGIPFKGTALPHFKLAVQQVEAMHGELPFFFLIGWDVAITSEGIQIIEANPVADLTFLQAYQGGIRNEFRQWAKDFAVYKGIPLK